MKNSVAFWVSLVMILAAFLIGLVMPESVLAEKLKLTNTLLRVFAVALGITGVYILVKQFQKN